MLKNYGYGGAYRDENISISVLLENPLEYGFKASILVFNVIFQVKNKETDIPKLEDFTFYIMDETNSLHSAENMPYLRSDAEMSANDDEALHKPDGLIITNFDPGFLFQNLRIAFSHQSYEEIKTIALKH